jgi:hypothetical protein
VKKKKDTRKRDTKYLWEVLVGMLVLHFSMSFFVVGSGVRGGGKCPEEEHTTCSGGPTILVTSAVYGEREKRE